MGTFGGYQPNGGRKKGTLNKFTAEVKRAFHDAFRELNKEQDAPGSLTIWAKANPTDFYRIMSKVLPQEVTGDANLVINLVTGVPRADDSDDDVSDLC